MANIIVNEFEVENNPKGAAAAAASIQANAGTNPKVAAVANYTRETGTAFLVVIQSVSGLTLGGGTKVAVQTIEVEIGDQASGIAVFAAQMNAAYTAGKTFLQSFNIFRRDSGISFAVAVMSN